MDQTEANKMATSRRLAQESMEPSPQVRAEISVRVKSEGGKVKGYEPPPFPSLSHIHQGPSFHA